MHTPGHNLGSSSLIIEDRFAFVGDLASTNFGPHVQRFFAQDWSLVEGGYQKIRALELEMIFGGHGHKPMTGEKSAALSIDHLM